MSISVIISQECCDHRVCYSLIQHIVNDRAMQAFRCGNLLKWESAGLSMGFPLNIIEIIPVSAFYSMRFATMVQEQEPSGRLHLTILNCRQTIQLHVKEKSFAVENKYISDQQG